MTINRVFWRKTAERAVKTFAQTLLAAAGGLLANGFDGVPWAEATEIGAGAALLSVLTSVASYNVGEVGSPSALPARPSPPAPASA
jgi:Putative lactococcus lactis phage r1t holin